MAGQYNSYKAYKPSGEEWLKDIPVAWRVRRGKFVFDEVNERSEAGLETLLSVSEYYGVKPRSEAVEDREFLTRAESLVGYKKCSIDDLAMNIMLAWKRGLGVSQYEGIISPAYSVFRFRKTAQPQFMHYLLRTDAYIDHFKSRSTGVIDSRLRLYPETFADIGILLPTLPEQTHIAAFLDHETVKIDALIAKQERLIELLEEKRQAVISHAVTKGLNPDAPLRPSGIDWLGDVPAHWQVKKGKHLFEFVTSGSRGWAEYYSDDGPLFFRIANLTRNTIRPKLLSIQKVTPPRGAEGERSKIAVGDLLVSITADLGSICVADDEIEGGYVSQHVALCRPNEEVASSDWLGYCILSDACKAQLLGLGYGGTKIQLSLPDIRELVVVTPPNEEQLEISSYLDIKLASFSRLLEGAEHQITLLKERRIVLISAAVTGKIDVRDWQPPKDISDQETEQEAFA